MTGVWSVVMVLLGIWPGAPNGSGVNPIGVNQASYSVPAMEAPVTQQIQESSLREHSLGQSA